MKPSTLAIAGVAVPTAVLALWGIRVEVLSAAIGAIGYVCASAPVPQCAIAAAASIILAAMSATNGGTNSGTNGASTVRRDLPAIAHHLPNGTVHDYLNTGALEVGTWHTVQSGEHTLRASRHADGYNVLRASLGNGSLDKRDTDPNAIEGISSQFGDRNWPVPNQWSQDEINNMAQDVISTENLDAVTMCSTISDDTDADSFDMSWIMETLNHPYTEIPPPCGA